MEEDSILSPLPSVASFSEHTEALGGLCWEEERWPAGLAGPTRCGCVPGLADDGCGIASHRAPAHAARKFG